MNRSLISAIVTALLLLPAALSAQSEGINMNMSIDADEGQMNMNISIDGDADHMNMGVEMDGMDMDQGMPMDTDPGGWDDAPAAAPAHSGPFPMDDTDFERYLNAIRAKDFEDSKLSTAKAPLRGQYLTAEQVAQVMRAFDFEATRLEFATLAHPRCVDPSNYYLTYDAFDFELSIEELEDAIAE